jgi:hypothetical protein
MVWPLQWMVLHPGPDFSAQAGAFSEKRLITDYYYILKKIVKT